MTDRRYELRLRPAALRQLRKLDSQIARRIKGAAEVLRAEPRPPGVKALTSQPGVAERQKAVRCRVASQPGYGRVPARARTFL